MSDLRAQALAAVNTPNSATAYLNNSTSVTPYGNLTANSSAANMPARPFQNLVSSRVSIPNSAVSYELEDKAVKDLLYWQENQNALAMEHSANEAALNREFQQNSADTAWRRSVDAAEDDRDWQEYMSNTAYQRAIKDLKAAGLNPILAYTNGGSSTPGGSTASAFQASGAQGSGYTSSGAKADYNAAYADYNAAALSRVKSFTEGVNSAANLIKAFIPFTK